MKEEKFFCPNPDCQFISFEGVECPECGNNLEKIKGDDYAYNTEDSETNDTAGPMMSDFEDDPDAISWYSDEGESMEAI
jgi:hypothetical protein